MTRYERNARADVRLAFLNQHCQLKEVAFDTWREMTFSECDRIIDALAANIWRYRRPVDERFTRWAAAWVRRQTRRHKFLTELFSKYPELIFAAINRGMYCSGATDAAVEPCDGEADLYTHLLEHPRKLDALMSPKRAKVSTMLFGLAKSQTRAFRKRINTRRAAVARRLEQQCSVECEQVSSPEEISEIVSAA